MCIFLKFFDNFFLDWQYSVDCGHSLSFSNSPAVCCFLVYIISQLMTIRNPLNLLCKNELCGNLGEAINFLGWVPQN